MTSVLRSKERVRHSGLILNVTPIGLSSMGAAFDHRRPHTCCRICGAIYQGDLDRTPDGAYTMQVQHDAIVARMEWSRRHARTHPDWEHKQLVASGRYCTPEAASKLASFGIIAMSDMALDDESADAGLESPRVPLLDVEGGN